MKKTEIAYIAGIIDGEGCVRITKAKPRYVGSYKRFNPSYAPTIMVSNINEQLLQFLVKKLGGSYHRKKTIAENQRTVFCYVAGGNQAEVAIRAVLPYLIVKRNVAEIVLKLRDTQRINNNRKTRITGTRPVRTPFGTHTVRSVAYSAEYIAQLESLFQQCKVLNKRGVH